MADASGDKICLALVWHMHQPHYENPVTGQFELPWVRLHGTKDYYDMAALAEPFPRVRFTVNVVPSLLDQIDDYVSGRRTDRYFDLSRRGPAAPPRPVERVVMVQSGVPEASRPMPAAPTRQRRRVDADPVAAEVDRVLDKISAQGLGSLTAAERRFLDEVSKQKKQDH